MLDTLNPGKLHVTNPAFRVMIANPAATALITPLRLHHDRTQGLFCESTRRVIIAAGARDGCYPPMNG